MSKKAAWGLRLNGTFYSAKFLGINKLKKRLFAQRRPNTTAKRDLIFSQGSGNW
jgi:hypothetical protein